MPTALVFFFQLYMSLKPGYHLIPWQDGCTHGLHEKVCHNTLHIFLYAYVHRFFIITSLCLIVNTAWAAVTPILEKYLWLFIYCIIMV